MTPAQTWAVSALARVAAPEPFRPRVPKMRTVGDLTRTRAARTLARTRKLERTFKEAHR